MLHASCPEGQQGPPVVAATSRGELRVAVPPSQWIVDDSGGEPLCGRGEVWGGGRMLLSRLILPPVVASLQKAKKGTNDRWKLLSNEAGKIRKKGMTKEKKAEKRTSSWLQEDRSCCKDKWYLECKYILLYSRHTADYWFPTFSDVYFYVLFNFFIGIFSWFFDFRIYSGYSDIILVTGIFFIADIFLLLCWPTTPTCPPSTSTSCYVACFNLQHCFRSNTEL